MGIILLVVLVVAGGFFFVYLRPFIQKMKVVTTVQYDKELTIVTGGAGNSGILVSDSMVLVIDTKMDEAAETFHKQVMALAGNKPIFIVNTHIHPDHCKGNSLYKAQTILAGGNYTPELWAKEAGKENMPTLWLKDRMDIPMGNDTATIFNLGKNVHTQSDVMVYLHRRKLLFAGDVILNKQAPFLFAPANPNGYLETMNALPNMYNIKTIVPGHGTIGGMEVLESFKEFFNDMKTAATNPDKKSELVAKYNDWNQIPFAMSTGAAVKAFEKAGE